MKDTPAPLKTAFICFTLGLFVITMTGCGGGSGYKKSDSATARMDSLKTELLQGKVQIDATITAMNDVVAKANTDPRGAFETFTKEIKKTEAQAKKVSKQATEMKKQGAAYFKKWEAEFKKIASPELQARFEQRKSVVQAQYDTISEAATQLGEHYQAFIGDVHDIQRVLSIDLTSDNIGSISDIVKDTTKESTKINSLIQQYVDALNTVSAEMRPAQ